MTDTMGIDQYGTTYHGLGAHPRAALLKRLGYAHADRMYADRPDGTAAHVGYVIGGHWITLYTVSGWGRAA